MVNSHLLFLFAAVKFGRMSKKQREKVEEEVNFHQSQNRMRGNSGSGTSPDPWTNPDSTAQGDIFQPGFGYNQGLEQGPGPYTTPNHNPFFNQGQQQQQTQQPQQQQQPGGGSTFDEFDVDSTTPNPTPFDRNGGNLQETDSQHIPPGIHNLQLRLQISISISKKTRFHNLQRQALTQFIKLYQYMT